MAFAAGTAWVRPPEVMTAWVAIGAARVAIGTVVVGARPNS